MEPLAEQFDSALSCIEISGPKADRVKDAHTEVRTILEADATLKDWGVDTVLIGSYARRTGIYPGNDVDIFTKMTALDTSASPSAVFGAVETVLVSHYGPRVTPRTRSLKIDFADDGFSVDVVPAVASPPHWAIPSKDRDHWAATSGESWVVTDPELVTELTRRRNQTPLVGSRGAYVPTVKLVRQARSHHLDERRPGGLYVELLTYWAFESGIDEQTFAECFSRALAFIRNHLAGDEPLTDPALGALYTPSLTQSERGDALAVFDVLNANATRALVADRCEAAVLWRQILGVNDRGVAFPLPEGCSETGKELSGISAITSRGSDEARGFGDDRLV